MCGMRPFKTIEEICKCPQNESESKGLLRRLEACEDALRTGRMCNMIIITSLQSFAAWFLEVIVRLFPLPITTELPGESTAREPIATRPSLGATQDFNAFPDVFFRSPAFAFFLSSAALLIKYLQVFSRIFF